MDDQDESMMDETAEGYHAPYSELAQRHDEVRPLHLLGYDLGDIEARVMGITARHVVVDIESQHRSAAAASTYTHAAPPRAEIPNENQIEVADADGSWLEEVRSAISRGADMRESAASIETVERRQLPNEDPQIEGADAYGSWAEYFRAAMEEVNEAFKRKSAAPIEKTEVRTHWKRKIRITKPK